MKTKIFLIIVVAFLHVSATAQDPVSRVTVGLGMGYNHLFKDVEEYSLSTDGKYSLKSEIMNRNKFVISPVVAFRLEKFIKDPATGNMKESDGVTDAKWSDPCRFSILVSADIVDLKADNMGFNKNIDGGFGISYAISPEIQIGLLYEFKNLRQIRNDILQNLTPDGAIKNGRNDVYNALDESDNNVFKTKTFDGFSIKLIFNASSLK